jgi:hypothetical protein
MFSDNNVDMKTDGTAVCSCEEFFSYREYSDVYSERESICTRAGMRQADQVCTEGKKCPVEINGTS